MGRGVITDYNERMTRTTIQMLAVDEDLASQQQRSQPGEGGVALPAFSGRISSAKTLASILGALSFRSRAICCITAEGLTVSVQDSKCTQANAYFTAAFFDEYALRGPDLQFCLDVKVCFMRSAL